jgi:hypothetical protein
MSEEKEKKRLCNGCFTMIAPLDKNAVRVTGRIPTFR